MPRDDYLIFIHGVATRDNGLPPSYSDYLFSLIKEKCNQLAVPANLIQVPLYWGDVSLEDEQAVLGLEKQSSIYDHFDAKGLRENFILPFVGDAVSYISRFLGGRIIEKLKADAQTGLQNINPHNDNRFHLIAHSWGTVILFDALFASRWDDPSVFGAASAMEMRDVLFGMQPSPLTGVVLRSIHTMGSPLDIFSLMETTPDIQPSFIRTPNPVIAPEVLNAISSRTLTAANAAQTTIAQARLTALNANPNLTSPKVDTFVNVAGSATVPETHAIAPNLQELLKTLNTYLGKPLNWYNFAHPGDFVAYPIEKLMPMMLANSADYLNVQDFLVTDAGPQWFEDVTPVSIVNAGGAHLSYWKSHLVAEQIARAINMS